ncbi:tetratricopeptide repeat protein, partial [Virgisporangium aliadipatigenens]|uniref:tetratricopeptide repeat protein n=1 Tax=Virgisporangium aliadipatigenens TaxID=741659 RepID=UPI0019431E08
MSGADHTTAAAVLGPADRVVAVASASQRGSGYVVAGRLVLTSAHVVPPVGAAVGVRTVTGREEFTAVVVWRGTPGGRDDAALLRVDDPAWPSLRGRAVRWGRVVTHRAGISCRAWGFPEWVQRLGHSDETGQPSGTLNAGNRYVGDRYVLDVDGHPPAVGEDGASPWAGLSGAAMFCGEELLTGVVATDVASGQHAHLDAVPVYLLHRDPLFRQVLAERGGGDMVLEAVELQPLAAVEPSLSDSPAALLRAGQQVVRFHGREQLMEDLLAWCAGSGPPVWLLHAPGGQGKTRTAHELARRLAEQRWATLWLHPDATGSALRVLAQVAVPLLVVVDYAETRTGQLAEVLRVCAEHPGDVPVRLLLLARIAGDWWTSLPAADPAVERLLDGAHTLRLDQLDTDPGGRVDAYRDAVTDLVRALAAIPAYRHHDWRTVAERLAGGAPPTAVAEQTVSALSLHTGALADLLDAVDPPDPATSTSGVEERLLVHERRYWRSTATANHLLPAVSESTLEDALAVAMLFGAHDDTSADTVLAHLPALDGQTRDRRNTIRQWIGRLYPSGDHRPWGSLQPDRLAEQFVGTRLLCNPNLVDPLVPHASAAQVVQLLTVYARAAARPAFTDRLPAALTNLCTRHSHALAIPAIDIATQVEQPAPLITALRRLTTDPHTSLDELSAMAYRLPQASHNLAEWATEITERLVDEHRHLTATRRSQRRWWQHLPGLRPDTSTNDAALAASLNNLSVRLAGLGRREPALAAIEEAVSVYRRLAAARPDAVEPDLAASLNNLSASLADLGRREPALAAIEESVTIRRRLAAARPDAVEPDLAASLNTLSMGLADLGRREPALAA